MVEEPSAFDAFCFGTKIQKNEAFLGKSYSSSLDRQFIRLLEMGFWSAVRQIPCK